MSVGNLTGIFSRLFIVGFYIPCFTVVAAFDQLFGGPVKEAHLLPIAGLALPVALLLLGLARPVWSLFEGYWTHKHERDRTALYSSRFGEAARQYRLRCCKQWRFDTWTVWPYVEALFTDRERELHMDLLANVRFFMNTSLGVAAVAFGFLIAAVLEGPVLHWWPWSFLAAVLCLVLSFFLYLGAVRAVAEWGEYKIASVALHRRELYECFGFPRPSQAEEERVLAGVVNALLVDNRQPREYLQAVQSRLPDLVARAAPPDVLPCERLIDGPQEGPLTGLSNEQVRATVAVADIDTAAEFYERTLGLTPLGGDGMGGVRIYPCGSGSLLQVYASEHAGRTTATVASWSADDFESVVDELRARGVAFETYGEPATDERGVHTYGNHRVVWFKDPDGNTIAVDNGGEPS